MSTGDKISSDELTDLIGRVRVSFGGFEDADALIAEAERFAARLAEVEAERDAANEFSSYYRDMAVERGKIMEAARPVVEAAAAWRDDLCASKDLAAAVDLYRSATSDEGDQQ